MKIRLRTKDGRKIEGTVLRRDQDNYEVTFEGKTIRFKVQRTPLGDFIVEDEQGRKHKIVKIFSSKYERVLEIDDTILNLEVIPPEAALDEESPDVAIIKVSFSASVKKIYVKKNDKVHKGQPILDLESMKMINTIKSPIDGLVEDIYVSEGISVMAGEKLVKIKKV